MAPNHSDKNTTSTSSTATTSTETERCQVQPTTPLKEEAGSTTTPPGSPSAASVASSSLATSPAASLGTSPEAPAVPAPAKYLLKTDWVCYRDKKCKKSANFESYLEHCQYHCPHRKSFPQEQQGLEPTELALKLLETPEVAEATRTEVLQSPLSGEKSGENMETATSSAPSQPQNDVLIGISPGNAFFTLVNCLKLIHLSVRLGAKNISVTCMGDLHSVNGSDLAPSILRRHHNKAVRKLIDVEFLVDSLFPAWKESGSKIQFKLWHELLDSRHLEARAQVYKSFKESAAFSQEIHGLCNAVAKLRSHSAPAAHHYLLEETAALTLVPLTHSQQGQGLDWVYPGKTFQAEAQVASFLGQGEQFISQVWVREQQPGFPLTS